MTIIVNLITGCSHECGLWQHLWHNRDHKHVLKDILQKYALVEKDYSEEEAAFTLVNQAYLMKEEEACPVVGLSTDRRALVHLGEVFYEDNVETGSLNF